MDRNKARLVLLRIEKLEVGESILIEDLNNEFPDIELNELLRIISGFAIRYFVRIDGIYGYECHKIEKYNKIVGFDRDGHEAVDAIRNDKIWNMVEKYLEENEYNDFSIFTAIALAKKMIEKEFDRILERK